MVEIFKYWKAISDFVEKHEHPFLKDWPMASSLLPTLAVVGCWLYFCLHWGPNFMRDRKPYKLKRILLVYNLSQIFASIAIIYYGGIYGWFRRYNWKCQPLAWPPNADDLDYKAAGVVWAYYIIKLVDLLDTVFFVLRKKGNQITTLHIYHHALMPFMGWVGMNFSPGGHGTLVGWINSYVHVIMYTYYLISGLGPQYQKYLWWKRHLTLLQLIQFCIIFVHNFYALVTDCTYPKFLNLFGILQSVLFLYMFGQFYYRSYIKNGDKKNKLNTCACSEEKAKQY